MAKKKTGMFRSPATWWAFAGALVGAGGTLAVLLMEKKTHLEAIGNDIKQAMEGGEPSTVLAEQAQQMSAVLEERASSYGEEVATKAAEDTLSDVYGIPKGLFG